MRIMVLGCDGYLGHPTCLYLQAKGHDVFGVDRLYKRMVEKDCGVKPLINLPDLNKRGDYEKRLLDIRWHDELVKTINRFNPDTIIHYAEQPSAPYSMVDYHKSLDTVNNNISGTLSLLWAIKDKDIHLVKLGTMGEYGTPNIDIEEGWLDIWHNGRTDRMLYPKRPGSFYHASKVADSTFIEFACRAWRLRATDLNQGVVYGYKTRESSRPSDVSFHYDAIFGTALNRFITQAAVGEPITVYGAGNQKRGFLDIRDTLRCVELACLYPAKEGEFRVFNQFTELSTVNELAYIVSGCSGADIKHIDNPRVESEKHYYNPTNSGLIALGLKPNLLSNEYIKEMIDFVKEYKSNVDKSKLIPGVNWR